MTAENGRGTSRSEFLKQAAGAGVVVAGVGALAGSGAATAATSSFVSGKTALDIDVMYCGRVLPRHTTR